MNHNSPKELLKLLSKSKHKLLCGKKKHAKLHHNVVIESLFHNLM